MNSLRFNTNNDLIQINYHLGGMSMPERKYSSTNQYRYGFNGKEKDNDAGEGKQDYGMRIYDTRLVRFISIDPITKKYPELTPYQFASNIPISGVDLDGLEFYFAADGRYLGQSKKGGTQIRIATSFKILKDGFVSISNWQELKQHSAENTWKGRNEDKGNPLIGLTHVDNKDVGRMISYMNVVLEKEGSGLYQAEDALLKQSIGTKGGILGSNNNYGLLDFKHTAFSILGLGKESNNLIEYNGTVYNPNEFGNLIWGAGMAALGVTLNPVILAEIGTTVRAAVLGNKKALNEKNAVEVMNGANKSYNSGQSNKDYSHEKKIQNEKK